MCPKLNVLLKPFSNVQYSSDSQGPDPVKRFHN